MTDLRADPLVRRRQRVTAAIAQAVELGTQNYPDGFYLSLRPHKTGQSKNGPPPPIGPFVSGPAAPVWAATGSRSPR